MVTICGSRSYLRISDHCKVTVRVRAGVRVRHRVRVADCCIQTAGEGDKMRINHVTKTDQWRAAPFCRAPLPHWKDSARICPKIMQQNVFSKRSSDTAVSSCSSSTAK